MARPTGAGKLYIGIEYVHFQQAHARPTSAGKLYTGCEYGKLKANRAGKLYTGCEYVHFQ